MEAKAAKKSLDAPHKIISMTLMPTGQLILATENRVYQYMNNVWEPMVFAPDPVLDPPVVEPVAPVV
jgi:hypothetical protein